MADAIWNAVIVAFSAGAAVSDVWWRKIPRWLTLSGLFGGLLFQWSRGHLWAAVEAAGLAFLIGLVVFAMGAIGGGDVKLMTALAAMMGLHPWLQVMRMAVIAAALIALFQVIRHRKVRQTLHNIGEILKNFGRHGISTHPEINVNNPALLRSPFGLAVAVGVFTTVLNC